MTVFPPENLRPLLDEMAPKARLLSRQCWTERVRDRKLCVRTSLQSYQRGVVALMVVVEIIELLNNSRNVVVKIIKETTQLNSGKKCGKLSVYTFGGIFQPVPAFSLSSRCRIFCITATCAEKRFRDLVLTGLHRRSSLSLIFQFLLPRAGIC